MSGPYRPPPLNVRGAIEGAFPGFWKGYGTDVRAALAAYPIKASSWYRPTGGGQHPLGTAIDFTGALEDRRRALDFFRRAGWWGQLETNINPPPTALEVYNPRATGPHLHVQRFHSTEGYKRLRPYFLRGEVPPGLPLPPMTQGARTGPNPIIPSAKHLFYGLRGFLRGGR